MVSYCYADEILNYISPTPARDEEGLPDAELRSLGATTGQMLQRLGQ